jgi:hypothetical protein
MDVVAEVRAHDARVHDLERAAERVADLAGHGGRRGRGHSEERGRLELLERTTDEEVVGPEVVTPHAHAVHLVHHHEPDPDLRQHRDEARLP